MKRKIPWNPGTTDSFCQVNKGNINNGTGQNLDVDNSDWRSVSSTVKILEIPFHIMFTFQLFNISCVNGEMNGT